MPVAVVQIGAVRVLVLHHFVPVRVAVLAHHRVRVRVGVVPVVVPVVVLM